MKKWQITFQKIVNNDIYDIKYWQGNSKNKCYNVTKKREKSRIKKVKNGIYFENTIFKEIA